MTVRLLALVATGMLLACAHTPRPSPAERQCSATCAQRYGAVMPNAHVVGSECRCVADGPRVFLHAKLRSKSLLHPGKEPVPSNEKKE